MVQIIEENRRPTASENFGRAFSGISSALAQHFSQKKQEKAQQMQMQQENEAARQMGIDLSGITDPKMRQQAMASMLQGQNQQQLEQLRQQRPQKPLTDLQLSQKALADERLNALQSEQSHFNQIMGNETKQSEQQMQIGESAQESLGSPLSKISEDKLSQLAAFKGQPGKKGVMGNAAQAELDKRKQSNIQDRKEELSFHKESAKYDEDLQKHTKIAKNQADTIKNIRKAVASGNIKPSSWANIFKGMGDIGNKISNALLSGDEATLLASIPSLLEGWKEVFGVRLSDADLKVLQDKLPDIGKTPEANNAIMKIMEKYSDMTLLRSQIGRDIKKQNKGIRPLGYVDRIEERFDEMVSPVRVVSPKTGNIIEIPAYKVGDAINSGAKLADE